MTTYVNRVGPYMVQCGEERGYANTLNDAFAIANKRIEEGEREAIIWENVGQMRGVTSRTAEITFDSREAKP